jgi:GT2 family glycosyltransferase
LRATLSLQPELPAAPVQALVPADNFDEAGYLRLNPDVRRAVDNQHYTTGYAHYLAVGHAEGRPMPGVPQEPRNQLLRGWESDQSSAASVDSAASAAGAVDAILVAPGAGLMIVGWLDDAAHPLSCIRIVGADWRVVLDDNVLMRLRRADVESVLQGQAQHAYGYFGLLHFDRGGSVSGELTVELWRQGGYWTSLQCKPRLVTASELRAAALTHLAQAQFFGNPHTEAIHQLDRGFGAQVLHLNHHITRQLTAQPYVERFGPNLDNPVASLMVCLYGKLEYFFLQQALFGKLPGIERYEFIYVCNSPELGEALLREARNAQAIYGLPVTVVILPGNAGFGAANNVAARVARSRRLIALNPDVFPQDPTWASRHTELVAHGNPEQTRLFGVPLYYDNGSLMHGGMYFEVDTGLRLSLSGAQGQATCRVEHYGKGAPPGSSAYTRPRPVPAVTGAFISIDRDCYGILGGFTEDFVYGHYEDADLCLKSLQNGTVPWLHDIRLWHLEGRGSTRLPAHEGGSLVNRWLFTRNWLPLIQRELRGAQPSHPLLQAPALADPEQQPAFAAPVASPSKAKPTAAKPEPRAAKARKRASKAPARTSATRAGARR